MKRVVNVKLWLYYAMWWYAIGRALVPDVLSWCRGKLVVQQTAYFGRRSTKGRDVSKGIYFSLGSVFPSSIGVYIYRVGAFDNVE